MTVLNWWKRRPRSDNARLRDLEERVEQLAQDATLCLSLARRIDARLRQQASRAARAALESEEAECPSPSTPSVQPTSQDGSHSPLVAPSQFSKEQLRDLGRARGLLPRLPH